jgi:hypothetical protein
MNDQISRSQISHLLRPHKHVRLLTPRQEPLSKVFAVRTPQTCPAWWSGELPDDGVHPPDLGGALQDTEGLWEGLGLVGRGQSCPVTTATTRAGGKAEGGGYTVGHHSIETTAVDMNVCEQPMLTHMHARTHKHTCRCRHINE